jgi:hypothetical protein
LRYKYFLLIFLTILESYLFSGCAATLETVNFTSPDEIFMTTGDGNIQKPYTPIGALLYYNKGFRLNFIPLLGLIPIKTVYPSLIVKDIVKQEVRKLGGDGVINLQITWEPPSNGFLGIASSGGMLQMTGTVIKR